MNQKQLIDWYQTPLGKEFINIEHQQLTQTLTQLSGNHLLQIGDYYTNWLSASRVMSKYVLGQTSSTQASVLADFDALPFPNELFDIVILPHILESYDNYPDVLREATRVAAGEGCLLILTFNPYSLGALSKAKPPVWKARTLHKLRYWLKQANCDIEQVKTFFYRPLIQHERVLNHLRAMEAVGQLCWPSFGACHLIVARKKVSAMTPIAQKVKNWWHNTAAKPVIEPTTRNNR